MTRISYLFLLILVALSAKQTLATDFYAYYTHLKTCEAFEKYSRTDDFADVGVVAGANKLVIWLNQKSKNETQIQIKPS
jgi:hypothetical protein